MNCKHPRVHCYKRAEEPGVLTSCDIDDPGVTRADVRYPNEYGLSLEFDSTYVAYQVACAIDAAIEFGKKQKLIELRDFLGIRC